MKKKIIIIPLFLLMKLSYGQADIYQIIDRTNNQKTANTKDILTSLFRAGINNVLGDKHSFSFSSSFYGIDSIFNHHAPNSNQDASVLLHQKRMRDNSFNFSLEGDSNNNITRISAGFTFTIINKKDRKYSAVKILYLNNLTNKSFQLAEVRQTVYKYIAHKNPSLFNDAAEMQKILTSWNAALANNNDFSNVNPIIKEALKSDYVADNLDKKIFTGEERKAFLQSLLNGVNPLHELFVDIASIYARKPLWTFTPTFTYDREHKQAAYSFASDFTVGLSKNLSTKPWEIEARALFKIENDTSTFKTNYDYRPFSISLGVNKVILRNDDRESKMEFKFFTQYDHQFGKKILTEKKDVFTLNSTFRVNVYKGLWIPVSLKYDPENSNFLGVFAITANIGN